MLHLLALVEKKRGAMEAARAAFERARRLAPRDPQILGNYANLLGETGATEEALARYEDALRADPAFLPARYNRALLLQKMGRFAEALSDLDRVLAGSPADARTLSARASLLRDLGRYGEAAASYDAALRAEPARPIALKGRARVALERGEEDASEHYRRALAAMPDAPELQLGYAEALEADGRPDALDALTAAVARAPDWIEGQSALARMRWEAGEGEAFTRDMERRLAEAPGNAALWAALAATLRAADLPERAAEAAAEARRAQPDDPALMLAEAFHASEAGELERSTALFAALPEGLSGRAGLEARHCLRCGDLARAAVWTDLARAENPEDIAAWAMTGLVWRLSGDPQAEWLNGQPGLLSTSALDLDPSQIASVAERLRTLHRTRAHPIGQSLRGGTQTRGRLLAREEPDIRLLQTALSRVIDSYWNALPAEDPAHPLLRQRAKRPQFAGSWSVRLTGGGFHVAHFHSQGALSSACYFVVPEAQAPMEGWLELGVAPAEFGLDLEPLARVEPKPGRIALFPSYLFHGTRPFSAGERLTVAFDVIAR